MTLLPVTPSPHTHSIAWNSDFVELGMDKDGWGLKSHLPSLPTLPLLTGYVGVPFLTLELTAVGAHCFITRESLGPQPLIIGGRHWRVFHPHLITGAWVRGRCFGRKAGTLKTSSRVKHHDSVIDWMLEVVPIEDPPGFGPSP